MDRVKNGHGIKVREKDGVLYSGGDTILAADDVSGICAILERCTSYPFLQGNPHPRIEIAFTVGEEAGLFGGKALDLSVFQSSLLLCPGQSRSFGAARQWGPVMSVLPSTSKENRPMPVTRAGKWHQCAHILCHILDTLPDGRVNEELVA